MIEVEKLQKSNSLQLSGHTLMKGKKCAIWWFVTFLLLLNSTLLSLLLGYLQEGPLQFLHRRLNCSILCYCLDVFIWSHFLHPLIMTLFPYNVVRWFEEVRVWILDSLVFELLKVRQAFPLLITVLWNLYQLQKLSPFLFRGLEATKVDRHKYKLCRRNRIKSFYLRLRRIVVIC